MRSEVRDRYYRVFTGQSVDRVPDFEFGFWPQTIRRWLKEGMPLEMTFEQTCNGDSPIVNAFFGFEELKGHTLYPHCGMNPTFVEEVLERRADSVIMRMAGGIVAESYQAGSDSSSIPRYISFPVQNPEDWKQVKARYRLDDPARLPKEADIAAARQAKADGKMISVSIPGFYWIMRNWMGTENLSLAFYDYPDMIQDMTEHFTALCLQGIERLPADIVVDEVRWDEDLAFNNGPLLSPELFRRYLQPGYHKVMSAARERGCELGFVDSDGNPHDIVPMWLEEGVNLMSPMEVAAGTNGIAWRKEFGKVLRMEGHVDKRALAAGGNAIDKELERIRPLLEDGGYIPHVDHRTPPDVSYKNYCLYLEKKRKLIGRV